MVSPRLIAALCCMAYSACCEIRVFSFVCILLLITVAMRMEKHVRHQHALVSFDVHQRLMCGICIVCQLCYARLMQLGNVQVQGAAHPNGQRAYAPFPILQGWHNATTTRVCFVSASFL